MKFFLHLFFMSSGLLSRGSSGKSFSSALAAPTNGNNAVSDFDSALQPRDAMGSLVAQQNSRALQETAEEEEFILTEDDLPTPQEMEEAFQRFTMSKYRGLISAALKDADFDGDGSLSELEVDRLMQVCYAFYFYNATDEELSEIPYEYNYNITEGIEIPMIEVAEDEKSVALVGQSHGRKLRIHGLIQKLWRWLKGKKGKKPKPPAPKPKPKPEPKPNNIIIVDVENTTVVEGSEDPHFVTYVGRHFPFHGECDLLLMKSESFSEGAGLEIQVRTEHFQRLNGSTGSVIRLAAIRIGSDVLIVDTDGNHQHNGDVSAPLPALVGNGAYTITKKVSKTCYGPGAFEKCAPSIEFDVTSNVVEFYEDIFVGKHIYVRVHRNYVDVTLWMDKATLGPFNGLAGTYPVNGREVLARDGSTVLMDTNEFGQEWQVKVDEGDSILFAETRAPQFPEQCIFPEANDQVAGQRLLRAHF